ncbi:AAA family ATPase [bacterium]|nr:AAA family ATPase [bacterium]
MEKNTISLNNIFSIIGKNIVILLASTILFLLIGIVLAITSKRVYRLQGSALLNLSSSNMQSAQSMYMWYYMPNIMNNQVYLIKSYALMERVYNTFPEEIKREILSYSEVKFTKKQDKIDFISNFILASLTIKPMEDSDVIIFSLDINDPELGKIILTTVMETYKNYDQEIQKEETEMVKKFLEQETEAYREKLDNSETLLKVAKTKFKSPYLGNEAKTILNKYSDFQQDYYKNKINLAEKKEHFKFLQNKIIQFKGQLKNSPPIYSDKINFLIKKISDLEALKISLKAAGYTENNEKMNDINNKLGILYKDFKKEMKNFIDSNYSNGSFAIYQQDILNLLNIQKEIAILNAKNDSLSDILDKYENELTNLPEKQLELTKLIRNVSINEKIYNMLKERLEESKIQNEGVLSKITIIDKPVIPSGPIKPKRRMMVIIGIFFGLFLGLFLIMLKYYLFTPINGLYLKEKFKIPFYLEIPNFSKIKEFKELNESKIKINPNSAIGEYLHFIRLNCEASKMMENSLCLITSPKPNMGKSTVSFLLAYANSLQKKVLLLDLDLKKPGIKTILPELKNKGLFEYYKDDKKKLKDYIQKTHIDNLDVLLTGVQDENIYSLDILLSQRLKDELNELKKEYGMIFIDSAPLNVTTDTLSIGKWVDHIAIIFDANKSTLSASEVTIQRFLNLNIKIDGLIINFKGIKQKDNYYYYNYYSDEK